MKEEQMKVSDDQQKKHDIFVGYCIKVAKSQLYKLKQDPNKLPKLLVTIVNRVEDEAAKNGITFDWAVKYHGVRELIIFMIDKSGIEIDDKTLDQMIRKAVGIYLKQAVASGKMTKEEVVQLGQDIEGGQGQQQTGILGGVQNG
jgi:hypothetical protein